METRTVTVTFTLRFDGLDAAELAYAISQEELDETLADAFANNVADSLFEDWAAGLQADGCMVTIGTDPCTPTVTVAGE